LTGNPVTPPRPPAVAFSGVGGSIMDHAAGNLPAIEQAISYWVRLVGIGIEVFGVLIIVFGIAYATYGFVQDRLSEQRYDAYRIRIGRSLLLGLEVLVAADIVRTIALELTAMSLALLAGLVVIRTFLSWALTLEIEGHWPWQRAAD
jgi:uncharacterized membrane protein